MSEILTSVIIWLITALFGGLLVYLIKKFLDNIAETQRKHADNISGMAGDIRVLVQEVKDFKGHCTETEEDNTHRLNSHSTDLKELGKTTAVHTAKLEDHERRIVNVEKKVS